MVKAARKPQALTIKPQKEVVFKGDPSESNTSQIHLFNPLQESVAFKILTNVPHLLFVRPTCDVIPPQGSCTVNVMSQASSTTTVDSFNHHKLLIQAVTVPASCLEPVDQLIAKNAGTENVMETKLACVFHVSYTSELSFPLETEEGTSTKTEVSKTPNRFYYYAIIGAILVCILAWFIYNFNFRSDGVIDGSDDDVMMAGVDDVMAGVDDVAGGADDNEIIDDVGDVVDVGGVGDDILETGDDILEVSEGILEMADDVVDDVVDDVLDNGEDVYDDAIKNLEEEMQKIGDKIRLEED